MATSDAIVQIGHVTLVVHDIDRVGAFYEDVIGLERISRDASEARYGVGGEVLVQLQADKTARKSGREEAGLFHTAFLLPERADLGAWLNRAAEKGWRLEGASDHLVSEALYLSDPEGNGIEIYRDRGREDWPRKGDQILMATERLDLRDVMAEARAPWRGAPSGTVIGHVHLQVGALDPAEPFYRDTLGSNVMARYPGANFHGWSGYHHHLATNVWNSRGAKERHQPATGLAEVGLRAEPEALAQFSERFGDSVTDPWGTRFTVAAK
ncbi:MAG: VOC family protein [Thioclava sp.]|nr:VOC family protein [Thioclava sp.]MBD3802626.1 VOC family protein [Thioclava sp.]